MSFAKTDAMYQDVQLHAGLVAALNQTVFSEITCSRGQEAETRVDYDPGHMNRKKSKV